MLREGFALNGQTQIKNMRVRERKETLITENQPLTEAVDWPERADWGVRVLRADRLVRNLAVVGAMVLTVVAVKNAGTPEAQSVFGALQETAGMEWDESIGKLSFVNSILPQEVQAVWVEEENITVLAPVTGETVHAWSEQEPYLLIESRTDDVRAAEDGEVMSIAHGMEEERIIRVRHDNGTEALYGNLKSCSAQEGARVYAGDVIGQLIAGKPLAFELRVQGRSVDPEGKMVPIEE